MTIQDQLIQQQEEIDRLKGILLMLAISMFDDEEYITYIRQRLNIKE